FGGRGAPLALLGLYHGSTRAVRMLAESRKFQRLFSSCAMGRVANHAKPAWELIAPWRPAIGQKVRVAGTARRTSRSSELEVRRASTRAASTIAQHREDGEWICQRKNCGWHASLAPGTNVFGVLGSYQKIRLIRDQCSQNLPHLRERFRLVGLPMIAPGGLRITSSQHR